MTRTFVNNVSCASNKRATKHLLHFKAIVKSNFLKKICCIKNNYLGLIAPWISR